MNEIIERVLRDEEINSFLDDRRLSYLERVIGFVNDLDGEEKIEKVLRIEYLLLTELLNSKNSINYYHILFEKAYAVLQSYDIYDDKVADAFNSILGVAGLDEVNLYYFYLASLALKFDETIRIRLDLKEYRDSSHKESQENWKERVFNKIFKAFIFLVRKQNGFEDIRKAIALITQLQYEQKEFEESYINQSINERSKIESAHFLLGLYHLSKAITETAEYLINGYNYKRRLETEIRIHADLARKLFNGYPRIQSLVDIFEANLRTLQRNSIWYSTHDIQIKKLKDFCVLMSKAEKSLIELLPSQRNALSHKLLDIAANVIVLEMPTSSGKTLLAEFNIIVTKALNYESKVIYIVPSRALVNQVYNDLKSDFEGLDFIIEKTSGAIEIDPSENELLEERIDVLVSTPEKLDLLIRRKHKSVDDVSLFIIDEAHMLQNGSRGAKLELLLSILKREKPNSKFMFLSPFLNNASEIIAEWIGEGKNKTSIRINWKPAEKITIGIQQTNNFKDFTSVVLATVYSDNSKDINLGSEKSEFLLSGQPKQKYIEYAARKFANDNNSIMFLTKGAKTIDTNVQFLESVLEDVDESENISLVKKFILDEVGRETVLSSALSKRIGIHHAGLSDETKLLVEYLIRKREIKYVFATTSIGEGVNFPVSAVYFDTLTTGQHSDKSPKYLSSNEFWNVAGRAGRTMVDNFGKLIFPFNSSTSERNARLLIKQSSEEIASVLLEFMVDANEIINQIENSSESPLFKLANDYPNSLEPLIHYLIHLLNSSNNESYREIEDLFKDSLGYFQLPTLAQKEKFIEVCKSIYLHLQKKFKKGTLTYADKTGFSVPSVLKIMQENADNPSIATMESWDAGNLFEMKNGYLTEKIKVIAKLRETYLGTDSKSGIFNPEAIARVLIGWVKGEKLFKLSSFHPHYSNNSDENERINEFVKYINQARFKASWGLSALEGIVNSVDEDIIQNSYIPSLVYFGVDTKEALLMRMAGIPRRLAKSMSRIVSDKEQITMSQLRSKIMNMTNSEWDSVVPHDSTLNGQEWKRLSQILVK